jgi:hypothetical protein
MRGYVKVTVHLYLYVLTFLRETLNLVARNIRATTDKSADLAGDLGRTTQPPAREHGKERANELLPSPARKASR